MTKKSIPVSPEEARDIKQKCQERCQKNHDNIEITDILTDLAKKAQANADYYKRPQDHEDDENLHYWLNAVFRIEEALREINEFDMSRV